MGIFRVSKRPRGKSEIISVKSIIRGALLVQDFQVGIENQFLVVDIIDGDMFLQVQEMRKA